jgi:hypothetical protein
MAKTCGCMDKKRKVTYSLIDSYHSLCHDKKDLILGQIEACQRLAKYTAKYGRDEVDRQDIENEIDELKMVLDLIQ